MRDEFSLLNDAELEAVSAGGGNTTDTGSGGISHDTSVSRVKSSDKHQQAVLAFIKG